MDPDILGIAAQHTHQYGSSNRDILAARGVFVLGCIMLKQGDFEEAA